MPKEINTRPIVLHKAVDWLDQRGIRDANSPIISIFKHGRHWAVCFDLVLVPSEKQLSITGHWIVDYCFTHPCGNIYSNPMHVILQESPHTISWAKYADAQTAVSCANKLANLPNYLFCGKNNNDPIFEILQNIGQVK